MKKILILGSTGSIGTQALEVISENPGLEAVGLAAGANHELIVSQARNCGAGRLALIDEAAAAMAQEAMNDEGCKVYGGPDAIERLIEETECDLVLNGIVGATGLKATVATLEKGVTLALANKESLVAGGQLVMELSRQKNTQILPVDSEHSAIFQCLQGTNDIRELDRIYLTASGGPFLGRSRKELEAVTREEALSHPRWNMGSKVTVDSATLMNKGLEIIEAHHLFGVPYDDIEVIIHPQSIIHSLARLADGSVLAQLGLPDMKLPIAYALNYPQRQPVDMPQLDLTLEQELTFLKPDLDAFPCLRLAREAGERGGGAPVALNAANEVAVAAFLDGRINFADIATLVEKTLSSMSVELPAQLPDIDEILLLDQRARQMAESLIG